MRVAKVNLHLFESQAFECTNCGRCCNRRWRVTIDPHELAGIYRSQAYHERARDGYIPLKVGDDGMARLGAQGASYCIFYDDTTFCSIHAELGLRGKPRGCQLFPYQHVSTPDGSFAYLSFACPPVVAGLDRNIEQNRRDMANTLAHRATLDQAKDYSDFKVKLWHGRTISWESYLDLEQRILGSHLPGAPVDSIIKIILAIYRADAEFEPKVGWPAFAVPEEEVKFPKEILKKYLSFLLAALEEVPDEAQRTALALSIQTGGSVYSTQYRMQFPSLCLESPFDSAFLGAFERYFHNSVRGKALLTSTVISRLLTITSVMVLVRYFTNAFMIKRQESTISLDALTDAFEIVEMRLRHHNMMDPFFEDLEDQFGKIAFLR